MEVLVFILGTLIWYLIDFVTIKQGIFWAYVVFCATMLTHSVTTYVLVTKHVDMYVANSLNGTEFAEPYVVEETTIYRPYSIFGDQKRYDIIDIDDLYPDKEEKKDGNHS